MSTGPSPTRRPGGSATRAAWATAAFPSCLTPARPRSQPAITWRSTRTVREEGQDRTRFGFAVLDLHPDRIEVAYVDDDGHTPHTETIT